LKARQGFTSSSTLAPGEKKMKTFRIPAMTLVMALLVVSLVGCSGSTPITAHPLIGVWKLEAIDSKPLEKGSAAEEHFMTFFEKEVRVETGTRSILGTSIEDPYAYTLPRGGEIDITRDGQTRRGIYAVKGDILTMAMCEKSKVEGLRPLDFLPRNEYDYRVLVLTFKRAGPAVK
jgi:hypothetical protein